MNFNFNGSREIEHVRDMHMDFASRSMKLDLNILHKIEMNILEYLWTFFMFFLDIKHYNACIIFSVIYIKKLNL